MPVPDSVVTQVREKLGNLPTSELPDEVIRRELDQALNRHNARYVWSQADLLDGDTRTVIPDEEIYAVVWLAVAGLAYELASRYAKLFQVNSGGPGGGLTLQGQQIIGNYLALGDRYMQMYANDRHANTIEVATMRRRSHATGLLTELWPDELQ